MGAAFAFLGDFLAAGFFAGLAAFGFLAAAFFAGLAAFAFFGLLGFFAAAFFFGDLAFFSPVTRSRKIKDFGLDIIGSDMEWLHCLSEAVVVLSF